MLDPQSVRWLAKPIVVNKTNALNLSEQYGKDFEEWVGKGVTVKAEPTTFAGKRVMGLRLYPVGDEDTPALKGPKSKKSSSDDFNDETDI
jgi:hypothetical protein